MRQNGTTREMGEWVACPHCGQRHTKETEFERWMRNNGELDSKKAGLVRFDLDMLLHRYMVTIDGKGTRDVQAMMFIEIKTMGARPSEAQRDTLHSLNQVLRNRRPNIHRDSKGSHAADHCPMATVHSLMLGREVRMKLFGGHLLELSGTDPANSRQIKWDKKVIDRETLTRLLRFELDPDEPAREFDWRRRSRPWKIIGHEPLLFPLPNFATGSDKGV